MKALLLSLLVLSSLNVFAGEVGESKAVECEFANQSKRDPKEVQKMEDKKPNQEKTQTVRGV